MSIFYAIALCVVFAALVAITVEAAWSVSKHKPWELPSARLAVVETADRRVNDLRYIGPERRAELIAAAKAAELQRLAA